MLKTHLIGCLLFITYSASSQMVYNWVNDQYDAGDWGDGGGVFYRNSINGNVKSLDWYRYDVEQDSMSLLHSYTYDRLGRLTGFVSYDSEANPSQLIGDKYSFQYNEAGDSVRVEHAIAMSNGEKDRGIVNVPIEHSILAPPVPDSTRIDSNGRVTVYWYNKDVTYTVYDDYGRKVLDSVPDGMSGQHGMVYAYEGNKVIVNDLFDQTEGRTLYEVDEHGNWIRVYGIGGRYEGIQKIYYYSSD